MVSVEVIFIFNHLLFGRAQSVASATHSLTLPVIAFHFTGTTKELHQYSMSLLIIGVWHMFLCDIDDLLWVSNTFWFMDLFQSSLWVCRKSDWYILIGIRLSLLPVPNLNLHFFVFYCYLYLVLQLRMSWCCKSWKPMILLQQIPMLPPLHLHCFGTCNEHLFVYCLLLWSVWFGSWIPTQNCLLCMNCSLSLPSQFSKRGTFLSCML